MADPQYQTIGTPFVANLMHGMATGFVTTNPDGTHRHSSYPGEAQYATFVFKLCSFCGAVVADEPQHTEWHAEQTRVERQSDPRSQSPPDQWR